MQNMLTSAEMVQKLSHLRGDQILSRYFPDTTGRKKYIYIYTSTKTNPSPPKKKRERESKRERDLILASPAMPQRRPKRGKKIAAVTTLDMAKR